jgi:hypothetical protein
VFLLIWFYVILSVDFLEFLGHGGRWRIVTGGISWGAIYEVSFV